MPSSATDRKHLKFKSAEVNTDGIRGPQLHLTSPHAKCQGKTLCSSNPQILQCTSFPTLPWHTALLSLSLVNIFLTTTTSDVSDLQLGYMGPWYPQFLWVPRIACGFLHSLQWLDLCHCQTSQTYKELDSPLCSLDLHAWNRSLARWWWQLLGLPWPHYLVPMALKSAASSIPSLQLTQQILSSIAEQFLHFPSGAESPPPLWFPATSSHWCWRDNLANIVWQLSIFSSQTIIKAKFSPYA